jgi:multidrug efflux pump subunit AcrB
MRSWPGCAALANEFPRVRFKVDRLFLGPPVGWPVQLRVQGPDRDEVRRIADEVKKAAAADPRVFNVHDNWHELAPSLKLDIDQDRARAIGITSASVRQTLEAVLSGLPLAEFRENDQTISVALREPKGTRNLLTAVENAYVKTTSGAAVPVSQVAGVRLDFEPGVEWRRDRLPTITVQGLIPDGLQSPDVTKAIYNRLQPLQNSLPLGAKVPVLVIMILLLLMVQLQSLPKTMLVVATAPLGIIGAAAALLAFQQPFGFVAILGVIALAGIIMRNSVILVDQIKQDIDAGVDTYEAIIGSAVRRFRPIVLTASAAVLALIPLAGSPFWGPMALAIMGGLIAATILTMTFLPALYALAFGVSAETRSYRANSPSHSNSFATSPLNAGAALHGAAPMTPKHG